MNELPTEKIRNDFDRIALFEQLRWNHNNHYHSFLLKQLPSYCQSILDIGCGAGAFSRLLAQRAARVIAVDLSPKMVEVAQEQSRRYTNIDFQVADILKWEFGVEEFDAIVSIATFHHLPLENLLPSLKAALKPSGKLVILDLLECESIQDKLSDFIAVPLNLILQILRNSHIRHSIEEAEAMREHLRTDKYLTLSQARQIYLRTLKNAKIKKHLFWRYSIVWEKSC
ncbi:MAG: methyltransferase domain-containing protein [Chroococcidiopsidaceae cyanobacterium CP_BM_ER_R8_30]|nr:methyltransferase domain-containing protein [Chroococcidiopsidaceae cyanobacterium CP_BM_ER_R8_30]